MHQEAKVRPAEQADIEAANGYDKSNAKADIGSNQRRIIRLIFLLILLLVPFALWCVSPTFPRLRASADGHSF